jgi:antibiotic biosynthesis monooxygenase (ABM) superfamily enzyme
MSDRHPDPRRAPAPPRYKVALLTWAAAYTVITAMLAVLGPAIAAWPLPLRTLLLSVSMVVSLTWLLVPALTRLFRGWLASASPPTRTWPRRAAIARAVATVRGPSVDC